MECQPINNQLNELAAKKNFPLNVTIELLQSCNLKCVHCYNFDRTDDKKVRTQRNTDRQQLPKERMFSLLKEIRETGGLHIAFTGGEVFLHPHLREYIQEARRLHLAVRLKTNATLLNSGWVHFLKSQDVYEIEVSLYGACAATHDAFTTVTGSFAKTRTAILLAKEAGLDPMISYVMHKGCVDEFADMVDWADAHGIPYNLSTELTKRYDDTDGSLDHRMSMEDLKKLYRGRKRDLFLGHENTTDKLQCACAVINCGIGFDGTVFPCIGAPMPSGDLMVDDFKKIWTTSPQFLWIRSLKAEDFSDCQPCEFKKHCSRSSGSIYTNTGNYTGSEPWTCQQAELLTEENRART